MERLQVRNVVSYVCLPVSGVGRSNTLHFLIDRNTGGDNVIAMWCRRASIPLAFIAILRTVVNKTATKLRDQNTDYFNTFIDSATVCLCGTFRSYIKRMQRP